MARQEPQKLVGVLNSNEVGFEGWEFNVYRQTNGRLRVAAQKAVLVGKNSKTGEKIKQLKLVDLEGLQI